MRTVAVSVVLIALSAIAVLTGLLPVSDVVHLWGRVWPILLFVTAITVVAELAAAAGVFTALARQVARGGRGRAWLLWLLVVAVAAISTVFLSLDTTAVLLTPVVVVLARQVGLNPLPFALTTVWMANTGSLLLPISNLTNLLAQQAMGDLPPAQFVALMWAAALVAMVLPMAVVFLLSRRSLLARYEPAARGRSSDPVLFWTTVAVLIVLIPLLVSGIPVWMPSTAAALVLAVAFLARQRTAVRLGLVPWRLLLFAAALFLFVAALQSAGLGAVLGRIAGQGESPLALLRLSLTGMLSANAVDNLPAYLALEPVAGSPVRLAALLIGVNVGPLITPWASLATLLWHQRLTAMDAGIRWRRYILLGAVVAPVTVVASTLALALTA
ncbi:SLC13 family permease [Microbacterium rhizosphaerae]|uniref:ArsB/NhaD family transporter n=1 Tax=Microbacterium rhizosphaerae TaxID=1678237 RepID=A0ABZ0SIW0_9MICO|nr:SLC13 family permease [Microbacterium rhizosphaerae]WPR89306.1 ArsB/NhaD family transporter [Microbacterium rhizosphaerae]